jgi:DCN1-like protein 1/2
MPPEQFIRFYRFIFHICKEHKRKHVQVEVAVVAWQLLLVGRFRLLERFCEFVQYGSQLHVVTEDLWRQVRMHVCVCVCVCAW